MYESNEKDYHKPIGIGIAFYIKYESNRDKNKTLFIDDYFYIIIQYLSDLINNHKTQGE